MISSVRSTEQDTQFTITHREVLETEQCPPLRVLNLQGQAKSSIAFRQQVGRGSLLLLSPSRSATLSVRALSNQVVFSGSAAGGSTLSAKLGLPEGELPKWEIRMLFDGDCPLCMREVDMLRDMDKGM